MSNFISILALAFISLPAHATLNPEQVLGESIVRHEVRRGTEHCVIPKHIAGAAYKANDLAHEQELCSYDVDENVAACPKTNSTNPGVHFFTPPPGMSISDLTDIECESKAADKVAKYKLSISCSYTPSILGYYHVSRALGGVVNVPVAVVRTMDVKNHRDLGKRAIRILKEKDKKDESIYRWWQELNEDLKKPERSERADLIFTDDYEHSYGALIRNPTGEEKYREFDMQPGPGKEQEFRDTSSIYHALINRATKVPAQFTQANAQWMQQLKDTADFLLLDTLMSQQDRFGNVHYKEKFAFIEAGKIRREKNLESIPAELRASAVKIKEMLLKDNDCGVNKDPKIKQARLLEDVAHIDPRTYSSFLAFARDIETPELHDFFINGLLFREVDLKRVRANIHDAVILLKNRCKSGALLLDLDMEAHFTGRALPLPVSACGE